jgi:hypothetical protein
MRNKKGFADPYTIAGIALVIIIILILGWHNTSTKSKEEIEAEKLKNRDLQEQLYKTQTNLEEANDIIQNQTTQINQLIIELNQYKNSYDYFPLFWLTNIKINDFWVIVINLSLFSFSLITIKFIFKISKK